MARLSDKAAQAFEELVAFVVPRAVSMLEAGGDFLPFAAALCSDGTIDLLGGGPLLQRQDHTELVDWLVTRLREGVQQNGYHATAVCATVHLPPHKGEEATDAIWVLLEDAG